MNWFVINEKMSRYEKYIELFTLYEHSKQKDNHNHNPITERPQTKTCSLPPLPSPPLLPCSVSSAPPVLRMQDPIHLIICIFYYMNILLCIRIYIEGKKNSDTDRRNDERKQI